MDDMNTRLSDLKYYMEPTKYISGEVDKTGPKARKVIETFLKEKPENIYLVGDSEEGFDYEHMEILDELIDWGTPIMAADTEYNEENDTELRIELYETKVGNLCVYSGESRHGTIYCVFADTSTTIKLKNFIFEKLNSNFA